MSPSAVRLQHRGTTNWTLALDITTFDLRHSAATYYLRDPHGDTVGVVSTAAANLGTTAFDPWSKPLATSGTQPIFGYQSDITDTLTKSVDMGVRDCMGSEESSY